MNTLTQPTFDIDTLKGGGRFGDFGGAFVPPALAQPLQELAEAFDAAGALDQLEGFASRHGPAFYGLPVNTGTVTLARQPWVLPESLPFGDAQLKPLRGGETLAWRQVD